MKHTKGEWNGKDSEVYSLETGKTIARCDIGGRDEQTEANARLIAAAPELYEAAVIACVEFYDQTNAEPTNKNHWYWKLKEAITKATQL